MEKEHRGELVRYAKLLREVVRRGDMELAAGLLAEREKFFVGKHFEPDEIEEALKIDRETEQLLASKVKKLWEEVFRVQESLEYIRGSNAVLSRENKRFDVVV